MDNPSMYLAEVCQAIQDVLGITVSASTICRLLRRCGLTRKKIRQVALKRCEKLRGAFMDSLSPTRSHYKDLITVKNKYHFKLLFAAQVATIPTP